MLYWQYGLNKGTTSNGKTASSSLKLKQGEGLKWNKFLKFLRRLVPQSSTSSGITTSTMSVEKSSMYLCVLYVSVCVLCICVCVCDGSGDVNVPARASSLLESQTWMPLAEATASRLEAVGWKRSSSSRPSPGLRHTSASAGCSWPNSHTRHSFTWSQRKVWFHTVKTKVIFTPPLLLSAARGQYELVQCLYITKNSYFKNGWEHNMCLLK